MGLIIELLRYRSGRRLAHGYGSAQQLDVPVGVPVAEVEGEGLVEIDVAFKCVHKPPIVCRLELQPVRHCDRRGRCRYLGKLIEGVSAVDPEGLDAETIRYSQPRGDQDGRGQIAYRVRPLGITHYRDCVRLNSEVRRIHASNVIEIRIVTGAARIDLPASEVKPLCQECMQAESRVRYLSPSGN